ncbi:uncharacterized protein LOC109534049 [Dendroctonus ponderosae]|uniref:CHK kinase-like domain-containing protein n=1 Tax=Dendroctonus ponderosae TaxID=77166 RepID=U4U159_DENPD|nr:uncharacterized protein LOC109534049 [Dendroctonus ponderosae]ERL87604.1 hypothetical protein D910_04995 [Dendroctonus ponderosae]KAH1006689.1 hypothetical protein HUJ05_007398 [Dendroctonus ponderosae]
MTASERVQEILKLVAEAEGVQTCEIFANDTVFNGDGGSSECFRGSIQSKDANGAKMIKVFIKVKPPRQMAITGAVFINEVNFYSKIYPELDRFQRLRGVEQPFDKIPKFFCGSLEESREYLAFPDLQAENYTLFEKSQPLDEKHLQAIFATYGKFHALTFAYKASNPEKYRELTAPAFDIYGTLLESRTKDMKGTFQTVLDYIKDTDQQGADKVQMFLDDFETSRSRGCKYEGQYSAWNHGDCWSNNLLFKYLPNGDLEDLKLLDHQCGRDSTPVHDLSYCFYSGASKPDFDKLDYYLDLYYHSFSKFAKELGADPDKLLPLEALKSDWKKYALMGIYMAFMVWEFKLLDKNEFQARIAETSKGQDMMEEFFDIIKKSREHPSYKKTLADILIHAVEYGII